MAEHVMENEVLRVTVADHGAELISVYDKETGRERIWCADPAVWNRHAPILFPFVGKVNQGVYRHEGNVYEMKTQHGFARDMEFVCVKADSDKIIHRLVSTEDTKKMYPFDFTLYVTQELDRENPRKLKISWEVINEGTKKMYYAIGGHPGFAIPEVADGKRSDYFLEFFGLTQAETTQLHLESGLALPREKKVLEFLNGFLPIGDHIFDGDALIFENSQVQKVRIVRKDKSSCITMECGGFPTMGIWSKPNGPFVCLEPWVGRTDDDGFEGELSRKAGEAVLPPKENEMYAYTIEFHK